MHIRDRVRENERKLLNSVFHEYFKYLIYKRINTLLFRNVSNILYDYFYLHFRR